ncbi:MAG: hypothetical protein AAF318_05375 [Pseudomonadota bacterium]
MAVTKKNPPYTAPLLGQTRDVRTFRISPFADDDDGCDVLPFPPRKDDDGGPTGAPLAPAPLAPTPPDRKTDGDGTA